MIGPPAVLADVAQMLRSALPAIHWKDEGEWHLPALLGRRTLVSECPGKSIELSLEAALTGSPVTFCEMARHEGFLAPAAHEDAGVCTGMAPLLINGLLGRVPPPLLSSLPFMGARSAW